TPSPTSSTACIPSSLCAAPRLKSRRNATEPFHWKGRTTRSLDTPTTAEVSTVVVHGPEHVRVTVSAPKQIPLALSGTVSEPPSEHALASAPSRICCRASVISSARRCTEPAEKTCGVLRSMKADSEPLCSGSRCTLPTARPAPSSDGRLWQALHDSAF